MTLKINPYSNNTQISIYKCNNLNTVYFCAKNRKPDDDRFIPESGKNKSENSFVRLKNWFKNLLFQNSKSNAREPIVFSSDGRYLIKNVDDRYYIKDISGHRQNSINDANKRFLKESRFMSKETFALYNNIQSQICAKTQSEILQDVKEVAYTTGVTELDAMYAIAKMTQFASTKSLEKISKKMCEMNIHGFYFDHYDKKSPLSLNSVFEYYRHKKVLKTSISLPQNEHTKSMNREYPPREAFLLDKFGIEYLEKLQKDGLLENFLNRNKKLIFINLEGWNRGINMFNYSGDITTPVIDMIASMPFDMEASFEELFDATLNKTDSPIFDYIAHRTLSISKEPRSIKEIANQINPINVSPLELNAIIKATAQTFPTKSDTSIAQIEAILTDFLHNQFKIHTPQSLTNSMQLMHKKIIKAAKYPENIYYVIPKELKSFEWVAYQYAHVNNVAQDRFIRYNGSEDFYEKDLFKKLSDKATLVILDDYAGTGNTFNHEAFRYKNFRGNKNTEKMQLLFAPVNIHSSAINAIMQYQNEITEMLERDNRRFNTSYHIPKTMHDGIVIADKNSVIFPYRKAIQPLYSEIIKSNGYNGGSGAVYFPCMGPDNNSSVSAIFGQYFVPHPECMKSADRFWTEPELIAQVRKIKKLFGNEISFPIYNVVAHHRKLEQTSLADILSSFLGF